MQMSREQREELIQLIKEVIRTIPSTGGATTFTALTDTPASYAGQTLKVVRVNAGETALEFITLAGGGDMLKANNLSDVLSAATSRTNLGLGTLATQSGTFSGTSSGTNTGDQTITLTTDVTGSGTGSFAATIAAGAVTLAKMANMATGSLFYRKTAGAGAPEVQTLATLKTDLNLTGTNSGDETGTTIATIHHAAAVKSALVDADEITGQDSAASFGLIRTTWTSVKAFLKTYFDTLYQAILISGTNIKTINGSSILGTGNLSVSTAFTDFTKDLGASRRSGTFNITGLSGLTTSKNVNIVQTAQPITSKGSAIDEYEMDNIEVTGYVFDATTIKCFWNCQNVVVGTYAFAYSVSQ